MKVLLKSLLKWIDVTFSPLDGKIKDTGGFTIYPSNILAVQDDERTKYVKCTNCGKYVLNTPEVITEHLSLYNNTQTCFNCQHLTESVTVNSQLQKKYELLENGDYKVTRVYNSYLKCNKQYPYPRIPSSTCMYRGCSKDTLQPIDDIFIKTPDVFSELITVDTLLGSWKASDENCLHFKTPKDFKLYANVSTKGVITCFKYQSRTQTYYFVYSLKYDKIFWIENCNYTETPPSIIGERRLTQIHNEVLKLR